GGNRLSVTVSPATLNDFVFSLTTPQTSGTAFTGTNTLTARDAFQNVKTNFNAATDNVTVTTGLTGTVSGLGSGANNVLNQAGDFTSGVANLTGTLTFTGTAGTGTFTATSASAKTGTSNSVTINAAAATQLVITGTGTQTAGAGQTITITAKDGN